MAWALTEKENHSAIHGLFDYKETAEKFLKEVVPKYVARSYYMNKALTAGSFEVIEYTPKKKG